MTLNQIVKRIKTIALQQGQVKNFYFGNVTDFLNSASTRYAACFLQDNGGTIDNGGKTLTFNFRLFLLDLVHVSDEAKLNELDAQSDMVSVALDMVAEIDHSRFTDWKPSTTIPLVLAAEELDDMVAGAIVDISISTPYIKDICAVPGSTQPIEAVLQWGYFDTNPYDTIDTEEFQFTRDLPAGLPSYGVDFTEAAIGKYIAVKEPATEPEKLRWVNTQFNNGTIPDQVFKNALEDNGYRYYVSRVPVVMDAINTMFSFNV